MASHRPAIAAINLPGLAGALSRAGFDVVGEEHADAQSIIEQLRELQKEQRKYIVIVGVNDPRLRTWATLQSAMGIPVLVANSDSFTHGSGIPNARVFDLPSTADEIMAFFHAPAMPGGDIVIESDGASAIDTDSDVIAEVNSDDVEDTFNVFSSEVDVSPPRVAVADEVFSAPSPHTDPPDPGVQPIVFTAPRPTPTESSSTVFAPRDETPARLSIAHSTEAMFSDAKSTPKRKRRAPVVISFAGKGGVGKTATAITIAERAAQTIDGLRSIVFDMSLAQGDVRTYLRLNGVPLPSIYDAAVSRTDDTFDDIIINPKRLAAHRSNKSPLHLGIILAPERDQADPYIVDASVCLRAVEVARSRADLVVIDTQIIEAFDSSGLIDSVVIPLLLDGAWGLGISDSSTAAAGNLLNVFESFVSRGVPSNRLMALFNRVSPDVALVMDAASEYVGDLATWMGAVIEDPAIKRVMNRGEIPGSDGVEATVEYTDAIDRILFRVSGLTAFLRASNDKQRGRTRRDRKTTRRSRGRR
jgi:MinD-like ATPase involved in chromosome partitioning or flagellar assembly